VRVIRWRNPTVQLLMNRDHHAWKARLTYQG
jgi:hypothetical protein